MRPATILAEDKAHRLPHLQEASRKAAKAQRKQENSNG